MEIEKNFGEFLKQLRKNRGLTLKQLAELSGVSDSQISRIELGTRGIPKPATLKKLAAALDVPPDSLLEKAGVIDKTDEAFEAAAMVAGALNPAFYEDDQEVRNYLEAVVLNKFADMEKGEFKGPYLQRLWLTAQTYGLDISADQFTPGEFIEGLLSLEGRGRMLLMLELSRLEEAWEQEAAVLHLEDLLKLPNIAYGNRLLTQNDRQRIESMLQLLLKGEG
nr:helix-turn-helix transcriptional regulator [Aneurinibacillus sp. XH2]